MVHLAHAMPYDDLVAGLRAARDARLVYERPGSEGLLLYVYTERCVFEQAWSPITMAARGLILDPMARRIVATPFPKFFNVGEGGRALPELPFEVTEKLDGSLIIIFHHAGRWRTATKGAFDSAQAVWAAARLRTLQLDAFTPGTTYLAEATYPENRIVVRHAEASLRLLGAFDANGVELTYAEVARVGAASGAGVVAQKPFASLADLIASADGLPRDDEGYVLRFADGTRAKVKGPEYRRIHAIISGLSPLSVWEALSQGDDVLAIRRELPEELWEDFDSILALIEARVAAIIARVEATADTLKGKTDKDVGLAFASLDEDVRPFIFDARKQSATWAQGRARAKLYRLVRPTGNVLPGYVASFAMNRIAEDAQG